MSYSEIFFKAVLRMCTVLLYTGKGLFVTPTSSWQHRHHTILACASRASRTSDIWRI